MLNNYIINKYKYLSNEDCNPLSLILCVSGGIDSMVMLDIFKNMRHDFKINILVSHINYQVHDLSNKSEEFVKKYCLNHDINFRSNRVKINNRSNFEAKARRIRYEIFNEILVESNFNYICTAHHLDDQIETLYMKYKQNAPITSFRGILEIDKKKWRPLLGLKKTDIKIYAKKSKLKWIEDSTNLNTNYLRNNFRHNEVPKLKKENPRLIKNIFKKKKHANNLFKKANFLKKTFINEGKIKKNKNFKYYEILKLDFIKLELNIKKIIIQSFLNDFDLNLQSMTELHWKTFWQFLNNDNIGKEFLLYSRIKFLISNNKYILYDPKSLKIQKYELIDGLKWYNSEFNFIDKNKYLKDIENTFILSKSDYKNKIYVRNWKHGDKIKNKENKPHTKISRLFSNKKFSKLDKALHPILVDENDNPILVPNLRHNNCNNRFRENIVVKWQQN
tara:strand:- start:3938 stop:5278 length:1341 start_codon:yes stop_codon:yes gene_type:complete